ncbi:MAG: class I SAM-dependent methyltransferase [Candidatus Fonsibacter ubiquis]
MDFDSKLLNNDDLDFCRKKLKEYQYDIKFPHQTWTSEDALLKWTLIANYFEELEEKEKIVVDLGSSSSPVPHIVSSLGYDVTGIDITDVGHPFSGSLVRMVLNDALAEVKEMDDNSVDYFTDSCAVTHFNQTYSKKINNQGWKDISEQIYRVLKPGGKFIIVSDVDIKNNFGEFIKPELIVKLIESSGLTLVGSCNYSDPSPFTMHIGEYTLQVAKFIFEK